MAKFTLHIETEEAAELRSIVDRIAGVATGGALPASQPYPAAEPPVVEYSFAAKQIGIQSHVAAEQAAAGEGALVTVNNGTDATLVVDAEGASITVNAVPDRDTHGIKRDVKRIHSNAAEPIEPTTGCWKRKRGVTDEQYDAVYLELAREAITAGVYTGPTIPELALESQVVDAEAPVIEPAAAPAPVVAAPAPVAAAAPAPGMSAQTTPSANSIIMRLVPMTGPAALSALCAKLNVANFLQLSAEQLRTLDDVTNAIRGKVEEDGALVGSASTADWKAANVTALVDTAIAFGLVTA